MTDTTQKQFEDIGARLIDEGEHIAFGKMMSAPAITYKGKVIAFYRKKSGAMAFRVGKDFDVSEQNIPGAGELNPFKNRPAMKGWLNVDDEGNDHWGQLVRHALSVMQTELDGA